MRRDVKGLISYPAEAGVAKPYQDKVRPKGRAVDLLKKFKCCPGRLLWALTAILLIAGCGGPIQVAYTPGAHPEAAAPEGVSIAVDGFRDKRGVGPRTVGRATSVVADMTGNDIRLTEDVSALVERAFTEEFSARGVKTASPGEADFVLSGNIEKFRCDVLSRDEVEIALSTELKDARGRVVWSGSKEFSDDRYPGVMGNTRGSIAEYISSSLQVVAGGLVNEALGEVSPVAGEPREATSPAPVEAAPSAPEAATGAFALTTDPPRAMVYINGVYYGLSPIELSLEPGIHELTVRKRGYSSWSDRVSVREGETTEMELVLDPTEGK